MTRPSPLVTHGLELGDVVVYRRPPLGFLERQSAVLGCVLAARSYEVEVGWENGRWAHYSAARANEVLVRVR